MDETSTCHAKQQTTFFVEKICLLLFILCFSGSTDKGYLMFLPVWNFRTFLSSLLHFCLVLLLFLFLSYHFSAMAHSPDIFPENVQFLLRVSPFFMALVEGLGDDSGKWYVHLAAIWHWYLLLCIYNVVEKYN